MPVRVLDLEWTAPLPTVINLQPEGLLALVRVGGRPAGIVRVRAPEGAVEADLLREAILDQVDLEEPGGSLPAAPGDGPTGEFPPGGDDPLSIVVCTRDRPLLLRGCLEALRPLSEQGHEVLIVDNAPTTSDTARLAAGYPYRYILEPEPGLNRARNRGLELAAHTWVAYTDDDCLPDPAWASALAAARGPGVRAVTGLVLPVELESPAQLRYEAYCANRRIFRRRVFSRAEVPPATAGVVGMGANMAFERAALQEAGGFDPRFDGGTLTLSGGDTEMFARLLELGARIVYTPEALVWHRHPGEEAALRRVIFGYGAGLHAFMTKRLLEDHDLAVLWTAPRWLAGPPIKSLWNWLTGRPATPFDLLVAEAFGSFAGPLRFHRERKIETEGESE